MNMILKRAISSAIAVFMAAGFLSVPFMASAKDPVKLTVTSIKGESGKDVTVSISISEFSELAAADLVLKYDSAKLLYKSKSDGPAAAGGLTSVNPNYKTADNSDAIKASFIHVDGINNGGSLLDFVFTVVPGWSGSTNVSLEAGDFINATYNKIAYEIINGTVTVDAASGENISTNEAGDTISSQSESPNPTTSSGSSTAAVTSADASDSTEKSSTQKILTIILSVCAVLVVGAVAVVAIKKKK